MDYCFYKGKIGPCGLLFLQETHSNSKEEQKRKEDFHGQVSFFREKQILAMSLLLTSELENLLLNNISQTKEVAF